MPGAGKGYPGCQAMQLAAVRIQNALAKGRLHPCAATHARLRPDPAECLVARPGRQAHCCDSQNALAGRVSQPPCCHAGCGSTECSGGRCLSCAIMASSIRSTECLWKVLSPVPVCMQVLVMIHCARWKKRVVIPGSACKLRCCCDPQNAWWKKQARAAMQARCCRDSQNALRKEGCYPLQIRVCVIDPHTAQKKGISPACHASSLL
jgi:hypothetical protein